MVAVVGTRHPSDDGLERTEKMARLLVQHEVVVVSGMGH
ncbi:MAG: DNA-processing protein DprA [Candidatus Dormibacteria bacterium]